MAIVLTDHPLLVSHDELKRGSVLFWSAVPASQQDVPESILWPAEVREPPQTE